jgi:hypothetical protein
MIALVLLCIASVQAHAAPPSTPEGIDVGAYLVNVPLVSLKEKKFRLDFYLWFRWKDDSINPMESFDIVNGHVDSKEHVQKKKVGAYNYSSARISATIYRNFALNRYPLDDQVLKLQIENTGVAALMSAYVPDTAQSGFNSKIDVPGWSLQSFESYASMTAYPTAFGDPEKILQNSSKSHRYTFAVKLKRAGWGNFIKLFSILFLAAGTAFVAFRISSAAIDARMAFAATAVFMAVLTQNALSVSLPESDSFGMADQLYNLTMGFIAACFVMIVQTHRMVGRGAQERAALISRRAVWLLPTLYVIAIVMIVVLA